MRLKEKGINHKILAVLVLAILACICCMFSVLVITTAYQTSIEGAPVATESELSKTVKEYYYGKCKTNQNELSVSFPSGIPRKSLNYYNTRSGGYFSEIIPTKINYLGENKLFYIQFRIYVSEDKVLLEEIDGIGSNVYECEYF